jgi:hypothetical protein
MGQQSNLGETKRCLHGRQSMVFGQALHGNPCPAPGCLDERGQPDPHKLDPVGRLGGSWYTLAREG